VEGPSKNDETMWSGRTRQNKLVHFRPTEREPVVGGTAEVVVTYAAPHWLRGDLLALAPPPRPVRIRIPVAAAPA
jgi:tRNA-2-methylthio-N6-dimethylallyladenosine synthase